jgi:hypothetical protein
MNTCRPKLCGKFPFFGSLIFNCWKWYLDSASSGESNAFTARNTSCNWPSTLITASQCILSTAQIWTVCRTREDILRKNFGILCLFSLVPRDRMLFQDRPKSVYLPLWKMETAVSWSLAILSRHEGKYVVSPNHCVYVYLKTRFGFVRRWV